MYTPQQPGRRALKLSRATLSGPNSGGEEGGGQGAPETLEGGAPNTGGDCGQWLDRQAWGTKHLPTKKEATNPNLRKINPSTKTQSQSKSNTNSPRNFSIQTARIAGQVTPQGRRSPPLFVKLPVCFL